jgi:hypothetical protein
MNTGTARAKAVRARTAAACVAMVDVRTRGVPAVAVMVTMCESVSVGRPAYNHRQHSSHVSLTIRIQRQCTQHRAHN